MNKFFTILFIPEKTDQIKKLLIPAVYLHVALILGFFSCFFLCFMIYDYVKVMQQLAENRKLVVENRELRERIQGFSNKLHVVEESLERIQTFATKLRIITNQSDENTEFLKEKATKNFPGKPMDDHSVTPGTTIHRQIRKPMLPEEERTVVVIHTHHPDCDHGDESKFTYGSEIKFGFSPIQTGAAEAAIHESFDTKLLWHPSNSVGGPETALDKPIFHLARVSAEPRHLGGKKSVQSAPPAIPVTTSVTSTAQMSAPATKLSQEGTRKQARFKRISELLQSEGELQLDKRLDNDFTQLYQSLQKMQRMAESVAIDVQDLRSTLLDQKDYLGSMPTLKPARGWYTSGFGMRLSPYTGQPTMHEGLDIANHYGKQIIAPAAGMVSFVGVRPGYGKLVTIDHGYGIQTQYGHVSKFFVKEGTRVTRGMRIAAIGSTGRSTGPHVHYEVRVNGIPVDPYFYILND